MEDIQHLQYPVGRFNYNEFISQTDIDTCISIIAAFPANLDELIAPMTANQLDMPYRPGGWNVRQVVHHCADSHMNAFIRLKLALTEVNPTIKSYDENLWAVLSDSTQLEPQVSIMLLHGLHTRWATLLQGLTQAEFKLTYFHPEHQKAQTIQFQTALYAWHCNHHLAHIRLVADKV